MFIKYSQGNKISYDSQKWLVDTEEEISQIPCWQMGSTVYVITTGESWMMDSKGTWHVMGSIQKDPIECECEEYITWKELPEANG